MPLKTIRASLLSDSYSIDSYFCWHLEKISNSFQRIWWWPGIGKIMVIKIHKLLFLHHMIMIIEKLFEVQKLNPLQDKTKTKEKKKVFIWTGRGLMTNKMRWSIDFFSCRDDGLNYWDQLCFVGCPVWSRPNFWNIRLRSRKRWIINLLPEMIGQIKDKSPFPSRYECNRGNCW